MTEQPLTSLQQKECDSELQRLFGMEDIQGMRRSLEMGANPDVNYGINGPLIKMAAALDTFEICELLIEFGVDVHAADMHGITPLHMAAAWGKTENVSELLAMGLCVNSLTKNGRTPLHMAALLWAQTCVTLLDAGANPAIKTDKGLTALDVAVAATVVDPSIGAAIRAWLSAKAARLAVQEIALETHANASPKHGPLP